MTKGKCQISKSKVQNLNLNKDISNFPNIPPPLHPLPPGDCVAIERPRGEAVGFQRFRMRVFEVWETIVGIVSNVIIGLLTLN